MPASGYPARCCRDDGKGNVWCNARGNTSAMENHPMSQDESDRPGTFGEALEHLMLRANVWDTTLARRLGVARPQVFRWRTGRAMPSRRSLDRLVTALQW